MKKKTVILSAILIFTMVVLMALNSCGCAAPQDISGQYGSVQAAEPTQKPEIEPSAPPIDIAAEEPEKEEKPAQEENVKPYNPLNELESSAYYKDLLNACEKTGIDTSGILTATETEDGCTFSYAAKNIEVMTEGYKVTQMLCDGKVFYDKNGTANDIKECLADDEAQNKFEKTVETAIANKLKVDSVTFGNYGTIPQEDGSYLVEGTVNYTKDSNPVSAEYECIYNAENDKVKNLEIEIG